MQAQYAAVVAASNVVEWVLVGGSDWVGSC